MPRALSNRPNRQAEKLPLMRKKSVESTTILRQFDGGRSKATTFSGREQRDRAGAQQHEPMDAGVASSLDSSGSGGIFVVPFKRKRGADRKKRRGRV
jgi:hypothetical protein